MKGMKGDLDKYIYILLTSPCNEHYYTTCYVAKD